MRHALIAVGVLLVFATACSSGPAAAKRAELNGMLAPIGTKPDAASAESASREPPSAVAEQTTAKPAVETADRLPDETQARADKMKRERDAQDMLAESAAVRVDYGGIVITLSGAALFAPADATLLVSSQPMMKKVAGALLVTRERDIVVEGHTDSNGTEIGNIELSRQRAEAVRTYLIAQGYPAARIRAQGIGQDRPVATNASAKGREKNRRMEIIVNVKRDEAL
ncbi:MAG: OmpA family protein [Proteobacteria bacterium]|jgi:outer membrane protein OmpA-like peptidoglycan-associated protein|nr:OmpA family protein [Pseudomonadota bacterium]